MRTLSAAVAAAALLSASAVTAKTRSGDSLPAAGVKLSPNLDSRIGHSGPARKGSRLSETDSAIFQSPLVIILGIVGAVTVLELTGVINIFDGTPDSP